VRILVLGPSSDVAAVRLYQAALAGTPPGADASEADVLRLSRALDTLQACLDAKLDEAQAFEDAAAARAASPLLDGAQLTEEEKLSLGRCAQPAYPSHARAHAHAPAPAHRVWLLPARVLTWHSLSLCFAPV
jgi:hypothetical protein